MRSAEQLRQSSEPGPGVVSFLEDEPFARLMVNLVDWKASDAGDAPRVTAQRHTVTCQLAAHRIGIHSWTALGEQPAFSVSRRPHLPERQAFEAR